MSMLAIPTRKNTIAYSIAQGFAIVSRQAEKAVIAIHKVQSWNNPIQFLQC